MMVIQEFALFAFGKRMLGDALVGQGIIIVGDAQGTDVINQSHIL